jgi:hypothetical protein
MSQVSYKNRMRSYRLAHLDCAKWDALKAKMAKGDKVTGIVPVITPVVSVYALAVAAHKTAGNELKLENGKEILEAGAITSFRNGLMDDVGLLFAQTSIVRIDGQELAADVWFADKIKANKKLHFRDFEKQLEALAKADKKAVVHRGVKWELADCILNFSSGKKGKQKKSILRTIDEI